MNKGVIANNKGILSNKGFNIITNVLWILAIVSMVGLLVVARELRREVKDIKTQLIIHRK